MTTLRMSPEYEIGMKADVLNCRIRVVAWSGGGSYGEEVAARRRHPKENDDEPED